ncbi:hypothetical protein Q1695_007337 [Nippostrongylus brasiliensis]|nr:hypothetical protein Q1695_007337 [Nippostrongylus brasiliensis]
MEGLVSLEFNTTSSHYTVSRTCSTALKKMFHPCVLLITLFSFMICSQAATTKNPPLCGRCLPRLITLTPSDGSAGSVTPKIQMLANTAAGCRRLNVICPTPAGFTKSTMTLNGGPDTKVGKNVTLLVTCFKASWRAGLLGSYIYVNSVKCTAS